MKCPYCGKEFDGSKSPLKWTWICKQCNQKGGRREQDSLRIK